VRRLRAPLIRLARASAYKPTMTIRVNTNPQLRIDALAHHAYTIPVVRELPKPPAEPVGDRTW
jgi:hypothetical protein